MAKTLQEVRMAMAAAAKANKTGVKVGVSIPLIDAKGAERHNTVATADQFAKGTGSGVTFIKAVISKTSIVKVSSTVTEENGDKTTHSTDPLTAAVWSEVYAK